MTIEAKAALGMCLTAMLVLAAPHLLLPSAPGWPMVLVQVLVLAGVAWLAMRRVVAPLRDQLHTSLLAFLELERKLGEAPVADQQLADFITSASDWYWETDADHRFCWFSDSCELVLGLDTSALLGQRRWDLAAFDQEIDATAWQDHMDILTAQQPFRDFRYWIKTRRGARWVSISGTPHVNESGRFLGYRGSGMDITIQAEQALRLKMLSQLVEQSPATVVITDRNGVVEYANAQFERVTGYSRAEAIGGTGRLYQSGETSPEIYADMWQTITSGKIWSGELKNRRKDGTFFWESLVISPILDDHGEIVHFAAVKEDITFRREASERLERQAQELQRSNEELEQFAYVASHDLRQPLRMVSSYLSLLKRRLGDGLDEDGRVFLNFAVDGAKRMDAMIIGLLELSRVGRGGGPAQIMPLHEVVDEALLNLSILVGEVGGTVTVSLDLPPVSGDRIELVRLFQNVIGNALKYHVPSRPPVVDVTGCLSDNHALMVTVSDNGIGMNPEDCERAFGIFQRVDGSQEYDGTGIGLAVCRKIVERHGGRISASSVRGQGSVFTIWLPQADHQAQAQAGRDGEGHD